MTRDFYRHSRHPGRYENNTTKGSLARSLSAEFLPTITLEGKVLETGAKSKITSGTLQCVRSKAVSVILTDYSASNDEVLALDILDEGAIATE